MYRVGTYLYSVTVLHIPYLIHDHGVRIFLRANRFKHLKMISFPFLYTNVQHQSQWKL